MTAPFTPCSCLCICLSMHYIVLKTSKNQRFFQIFLSTNTTANPNERPIRSVGRHSADSEPKPVFNWLMHCITYAHICVYTSFSLSLSLFVCVCDCHWVHWLAKPVTQTEDLLITRLQITATIRSLNTFTFIDWPVIRCRERPVVSSLSFSLCSSHTCLSHTSHLSVIESSSHCLSHPLILSFITL